MDTLFSRLLDYAKKKRISFSMPGHKGGRGFSEEFKSMAFQMDVTELPDTESLNSPKETIKNLKEKLSEIYGAKESFVLTGGSTSGVHIMLSSAIKKGKLLTQRNCHRSVINAAAILGFDIEFLPTIYDENTMTPLPPTKEMVEAAVKNYQNIDAVLITSPDYYGHIADIKGIGEVLKKYNIPLLVDEAHGAHFPFLGVPNAIKEGADMAVESAHKTLNALNQAAYLHVSGDIISPDTVRMIIPMHLTSSPSYPIVVSAETALTNSGGWKILEKYIKAKKELLKNSTKVLYPDGITDETRVVFCLKNYCITGYEFEKILRLRYNIDSEMSDRFNIVFIITPSNTLPEIDTLFKAAEEILSDTPLKKAEIITFPPTPKKRLSPKDTMQSDGEMIEVKKSHGRILKSNITAYPPGSAILVMGEEMSEDLISYIDELKDMGHELEGIENDKILAVKE